MYNMSIDTHVSGRNRYSANLGIRLPVSAFCAVRLLPNGMRHMNTNTGMHTASTFSSISTVFQPTSQRKSDFTVRYMLTMAPAVTKPMNAHSEAEAICCMAKRHDLISSGACFAAGMNSIAAATAAHTARWPM